MHRFAGRVALATGVSSGIGERVAEDLVRAGVVVVGVARRQQRLTDLAARLSGAKGKLVPLPADLSREDEVRRVFQWVEDNHGGVSIVVNNAAALSITPLQATDVSKIQQVVNLNLTSVMLSCREALLSMKKHGIKDGHIVNINSTAGQRIVDLSPSSASVYAATKHGITALCKGLRFDAQQMEGFKIRVSSISPGGVATEMLGNFFEGAKKFDTSAFPTLTAEDVSSAVSYALSCPPTVEITELTIQPTGGK